MNKKKLKEFSRKLTADRNNYMSAFRKNIDMYIAEKDITLSQVADEAEISFSTLRTFLYGTSKDCNLSTAIKLARAFGVSVDELVGSETIESMSRESLAICRNLPDHALYLIRSFIRHQDKVYSKLDDKSINIPVLLPECFNGYMPATNITTTVCIDHLTDNLKSKVCLGIQIPCEHYEPFYMPNEIILLSADRGGLNGEKCVLCYKGNYFIAIKRIYTENNEKKVKYISLINNTTEIFPDEIDDKLGYVVGFLNPDGTWGRR